MDQRRAMTRLHRRELTDEDVAARTAFPFGDVGSDGWGVTGPDLTGPVRSAAMTTPSCVPPKRDRWGRGSSPHARGPVEANAISSVDANRG